MNFTQQPTEKPFAGKRALVVGGTGGIGRAVALGLAEKGAVVTITGGSSQERLESVLADLQGTSGAQQIRGVCGMDVMPLGRAEGVANKCMRRPQTPKATMASHSGFLCPIGPGGFSPEKGASFILEQAGQPDILIVAWGPFKRQSLPETSPEKWRFLIENNLLFPGILVSSVLDAMIQAGWGRIVLFGGTNTAEIRGFSATAAYGAAKTALGVLAKSAALNAGPGVTCNVICPGLVDTEYTGPEDKAYNRRKSPGPVLLPAEVGRFALEVAANQTLNGAVIPFDGGLRI